MTAKDRSSCRPTTLTPNSSRRRWPGTGARAQHAQRCRADLPTICRIAEGDAVPRGIRRGRIVAEAAAVVAKYAWLFAENRPATQISLQFSAAGSMSLKRRRRCRRLAERLSGWQNARGRVVFLLFGCAPVSEGY